MGKKITSGRAVFNLMIEGLRASTEKNYVDYSVVFEAWGVKYFFGGRIEKFPSDDVEKRTLKELRKKAIPIAIQAIDASDELRKAKFLMDFLSDINKCGGYAFWGRIQILLKEREEKRKV